MLKAQAKALPRQQAKLAAVAAKIPDNPALPALIRALSAAATSTGVELVGVTPGAPVAAAAAAPAAPAAPAATAAGAAAAPAAPAASSAGQLAAIPINMNVVGGYFQVEQFVSKLEALQRAMRVSNIVIAPGANPVKPGKATASLDDGKSLASTITAQVFMAANRPAATAVTVPGQPAVSPVGPAAPVTTAKK
jgi:Tfp pilus assembly protein PilO